MKTYISPYFFASWTPHIPAGHGTSSMFPTKGFPGGDGGNLYFLRNRIDVTSWWTMRTATAAARTTVARLKAILNGCTKAVTASSQDLIWRRATEYRLRFRPGVNCLRIAVGVLNTGGLRLGLY